LEHRRQILRGRDGAHADANSDGYRNAYSHTESYPNTEAASNGRAPAMTLIPK
jgi:hypothetical protein